MSDMALKVWVLTLVVVLAMFAPRSAHACTDAYVPPPNATCSSDEAGAWIMCNAHSDCPAPQLCYENVCTCLSSCPYGETCNGNGCSCKLTPDNCTHDAQICGHQRGVPYAECATPAPTTEDGGCAVGGFSTASGIGPGIVLVVALERLLRRRR